MQVPGVVGGASWRHLGGCDSRVSYSGTHMLGSTQQRLHENTFLKCETKDVSILKLLVCYDEMIHHLDHFYCSLLSVCLSSTYLDSEARSFLQYTARLTVSGELS